MNNEFEEHLKKVKQLEIHLSKVETTGQLTKVVDKYQLPMDKYLEKLYNELVIKCKKGNSAELLTSPQKRKLNTCIKKIHEGRLKGESYLNSLGEENELID